MSVTRKACRRHDVARYFWIYTSSRCAELWIFEEGETRRWRFPRGLPDKVGVRALAIENATCDGAHIPPGLALWDEGPCQAEQLESDHSRRSDALESCPAVTILLRGGRTQGAYPLAEADTAPDGRVHWWVRRLLDKEYLARGI